MDYFFNMLLQGTLVVVVKPSSCLFTYETPFEVLRKKRATM